MLHEITKTGVLLLAATVTVNDKGIKPGKKVSGREMMTTLHLTEPVGIGLQQRNSRDSSDDLVFNREKISRVRG